MQEINALFRGQSQAGSRNQGQALVFLQRAELGSDLWQIQVQGIQEYHIHPPQLFLEEFWKTGQPNNPAEYIDVLR
ncbi:MAG: hypothetical protein ACLFPG_08890, partial [Desulfohalobiaceae bacterium]